MRTTEIDRRAGGPWALPATAALVFTLTTSLSAAGPSPAPPALVAMDGLDGFAARFDAEAEVPRLVLLLSPT